MSSLKRRETVKDKLVRIVLCRETKLGHINRVIMDKFGYDPNPVVLTSVNYLTVQRGLILERKFTTHFTCKVRATKVRLNGNTCELKEERQEFQSIDLSLEYKMNGSCLLV